MTAITELKQLTATNQPPTSRVAIMPPNVSKGKKKKKKKTVKTGIWNRTQESKLAIQ